MIIIDGTYLKSWAFHGCFKMDIMSILVISFEADA